MIIKTVYLTKIFKNGNIRERWYDIEKNQQGYAIQRNGYTLTGRLSGYGASQILEDYIYEDKQTGWIENYKRETYEFDVSITEFDL